MKRFFIILTLLVLAFSAEAQKGEYQLPEQSSFTDRLYYGGGFGLSGGSWGGSISISPIVGYMVNNRLSFGVGLTYRYYSYKGYPQDYTDNQWGARFFGRVNLFGPLFAYVEYSFLNYSYLGDQNDRRVVERLPIGLGLSQPIGGRSSINILGAYDVLYLENGPYNSPWVFAIFFSI